MSGRLVTDTELAELARRPVELTQEANAAAALEVLRQAAGVAELEAVCAQHFW